MSTNIEHVNIGTLPMKTFPPDNGKTYLYKRPNGHIYYYCNGNEVHIPTDGTDEVMPRIKVINDVNINENLISQIDNIQLPDVNHYFLFFKGTTLCAYNNEGDVIFTKNSGTDTSTNEDNGISLGANEWGSDGILVLLNIQEWGDITSDVLSIGVEEW